VELEDPKSEFRPIIDTRLRMPEPLPVRLIAIEDVRLPAPPNIQEKLDAFYVTLLQFERQPTTLSYRADNFTLHFQPQTDETVIHESLRAQGIEVLSLAEAEKKLIAAELEYTRQKGLTPGTQTLLLLDPAGNWVELSERRIVP
jgi:hypothetical protein